MSTTKDVESVLPEHDEAKSLTESGFEMIKIFLSELFATALLLFLGCAGGLDWDHGTHGFLSSISFGLAVAALVQSFGQISGAHLNPCVTIAAVLLKVTAAPMAIVYVAAQMIGATAGYAALQQLTPERIWTQSSGNSGVCVTSLHSELTPVQGVIIEFLATTVLVLLCCSCWDPRNRRWQDGLPLKFGFTITLLSFVIGPFTGCSMNPARTFGPAIGSNTFGAHWIYWVGPVASSITVPLAYKAVFWPTKRQRRNSSFSSI